MAPLSKSLFVAGVQCHKLLWWKVHEPLAVELQPDKVLLDRFDQGQAVGELARDLFPGGTLVSIDRNRDTRLTLTQRALAAGTPVLFESAFQTSDVFVSPDILQRDAGGNALIEVKSASSQKNEHIVDAAVQAHVLQQNGVELDRVEIMHLNKEFRHPDVGDLFARADVTSSVRDLLPVIPDVVRQQVDALAGPLPTVAIGRHCDEPRECPFLKRCWPDDPRHISKLYRVGIKTAASYMAAGVHHIDDLPKNAKLQFPQQRQLKSMSAGTMIVEPGLAAALADFDVEPLGFLDFETISRAIPVWDGLAPWGPAAAQFSYHESRPDGTYRHVAHLAEGPLDARPELARRLVDATANARKVVMYSPYEKTQIRSLQSAVPELAAPLRALEDKLIDLLPVVRDNVYHPGFRGSFSIKDVLHPLVPELSYNDLVIVDGLVASVEIARLLFVADKIDPSERDRVRRDLLDYCERDTWATVRLLQELRKLAAQR
jgi:predicted RecB family nuclease